MTNTHMLFKELVARGIPESQAEGIIDKFATKDQLDEIKSIMATKADLKDMTIAIKADLQIAVAELRSEFKVDIAELRGELKGDIAEIRSEITKVKTDILQWMIPFSLTMIGMMIGILLKVM
jgi:hypothetical protein